MRLLWNLVDDSTVLFCTVVVHGEMLWFCRVPAWAWEKDAKIVEICKTFSRRCGVFLSSGDFPSLMRSVMPPGCKPLDHFSWPLPLQSNKFSCHASDHVLHPVNTWCYDKRSGISIATLTRWSLKPIEDIMVIETSSDHAIVLNDYSKIFSSLLIMSKGCDYC